MINIFRSSLFRHSVLTFSGGFSDPNIYDLYGNPIYHGEDTVVTVIAQLDAEQKMAGAAKDDIDPSDSNSVIYRGHVIEVRGGMLPPIGTKGKGVINEAEGDVLLMPIAQTSIAASNVIFGQRLRVRFNQIIEYRG